MESLQAQGTQQPPDHEADEPLDSSVSVMLLIAASIFELISASLECSSSNECGSLHAYAVAVGVVSLLLLGPVTLVHFAEPLAPPQIYKALPHLSLLLLVWWLPAGFVLTFIEPFAYLSNGYFATIGSCYGALQLSRSYVPPVDEALRMIRDMSRAADPERTVLLLLALTSTACWVQAAICVGKYHDTPATKAWAIIVGVVSMLLCTFYLLLENLTLHRLGFAMLLALWWCQGIAFSFVPNTFISSMNGFISTWTSVGLAVYFLRTTRSPRELLPTAPPDEEGLGGPTTTYHAHGEAPADEAGQEILT